MITITIDGKEIQTEPSKTIIEAAFENGVYIPHFCWHPALSISGNCRMCLVEIEKMPKQVIACSTRCMDGMVVHVNSEKAIQAREAVMEFILINHPLDCPICDEAGECKLQEYAYRYSVGESRFDEEKVHKRKRDQLGPNVMFDAERCISCSRCIRFCEDIVGYPQLTFVERGDHVTIETFPGKSLDNPYSMNVIDICPVGALTSVDFRFKSRVWDLSDTPSVCPGCARGCNMDTWVRQNEILRLTPRENQEVNNFWMCDTGRLESFRHVNAPTRVDQPLLRRDGTQRVVDWDEALAAVVSELRVFKGEQIAVIASPFDTCEDNFVAARFAREVLKTPFLDLLPHVIPGDQDDFLIREDKTPNTAGARMAGVQPDSPAHGLAGILEGLSHGRIKAVVITDPRAAEHAGLMEALAKAQYVLAIVSNTSALTERADAVLSAATFAEKLGTFLNFEGQLQLIRPSINTAENERWTGAFTMSRLDKFASEFDRWGRMKRADARSAARILTNLGQLLGARWKYDHPEDIFDEMVTRIPALKGLTYERLGRWGVRLDGGPPAHLLPYVYSDVRP
ncbi:MAG: 2Fe-2S iron-sulfur cluster-binding protein [Bacteroidota bacterium]|jgi:NADH-quinone oxidoreductase subunit G|nr:2Fe-2S iron-sulfur cluster-binding protein [Bacteroidota bacterium]